MSTLSAERLYQLLPAILRMRDAEQGHPLRALVALIAREFEALEENLEQLYDDQFIETCAPWVAPYIGDLIGYRALHGVTPALASPRAEVANTIAYRRRKGTAAMLEQLARDVTHWPARAVEFFEQLACTQYMNHVRLHAPACADLRASARLLQRGGPFNSVAHTAEMRRPQAGSGRYNIPNIGIFLWRLQAFRLSAVSLTPDPGEPSGRRYRFNPLGADQPLFRLPVSETHITHLATPANVPAPLTVRLMAMAFRAAGADPGLPVDYGPTHSVMLLRAPALPGAPARPVDASDIRICDLRDVAGGWAHQATLGDDKIAIDPERGRVLLGAAVEGPLLASFHSGFARAIGGGEYERSLPGAAFPTERSAGAGEALQPHLDAIARGGRLLIGDSLTYRETPLLRVDPAPDADLPGLEVVVCARNGARPLIAASGPVRLAIGARGRLVLDGLVISGGGLLLEADADTAPRELVLRDCTLVPGLSLNTDLSAVAPGAPSLVAAHAFVSVALERCITGALQVAGPAQVHIRDCIIDAGDPAGTAFDGDGAGGPGAALTIAESTVVGKVHTRVMRLASNSLFVATLGTPPAEPWKAPVMAERRQEGCVRFSYVPAGSITPRRHRCLPDPAHPTVQPQFSSLRYGDPAYGQLRRATARSIREGADDGGEMGVMHALFEPQRETNLRVRLDEYLRFGLHAGIFYAT